MMVASSYRLACRNLRRCCAYPLDACWARAFHSTGVISGDANNSAFPLPPAMPVLNNQTDSDKARDWIAQFNLQTIPKSLVTFTYARSSGPGGQNVNKVNTKATLRCPIDAPWVPMWAKVHLKKMPAYVSSAQSIQITSTVYRSQAQNVQECLSKFHKLIVEAASASLITEPSERQQARVRELQRVENAKRRSEKTKRSETKRSRSSRDWD